MHFKLERESISAASFWCSFFWCWCCLNYMNYNQTLICQMILLSAHRPWWQNALLIVSIWVIKWAANLQLLSDTVPSLCQHLLQPHLADGRSVIMFVSHFVRVPLATFKWGILERNSSSLYRLLSASRFDLPLNPWDEIRSYQSVS